MKSVLMLATMVCLFSAARADNAQPTSAPTSSPASVPAASPARIASLIEQLGHDSAAQRERASKELAAIGGPAMKALRQAAQHDDREIAARAEDLLEAIPRSCLLWTAWLPSWTGAFALTDDLAIATGGDGKIRAFSRTDGQPKWEAKIDSEYPWLHVVNGSLVCQFIGKTGSLIGLNLATGEPLWRNEPHGGLFVVMPNGIFYSSRDTRLADDIQLSGLSPQDGTTTWTIDVVEFFDLEDPRERWDRWHTERVCLLSVMRRTGQTILVKVDPATGEKVWQITWSGAGSHTVDEDGGRLYAVTYDAPTRKRVFTMHDLKTGKAMDSALSAREWPDDVINLFVADGRLLCRTPTSLTAYDIAGGKRLWDYTPDNIERTDRLPFNVGDVSVHDGMAMFLVPDGLLALDLETGKPAWKFSVSRHHKHFMGRLTVRDGIAYFQTAEGPRDDKGMQRSRLYALDIAKAKHLGLPDEEAGE